MVCDLGGGFGSGFGHGKARMRVRGQEGRGRILGGGQPPLAIEEQTPICVRWSQTNGKSRAKCCKLCECTSLGMREIDAIEVWLE